MEWVEKGGRLWPMSLLPSKSVCIPTDSDTSHFAMSQYCGLLKCKQLLEMSINSIILIKHNKLQLLNIIKLCLKLALEPKKTGSRTCQPSTFPLDHLGSPDAITHIYDLVNTMPFNT